jgi:hypothetical protein
MVNLFALTYVTTSADAVGCKFSRRCQHLKTPISVHHNRRHGI